MVLYPSYHLSQSIVSAVLTIRMRKLMLIKISPQYPLTDTSNYEDTSKNSRYQSLQTGITISVTFSCSSNSTVNPQEHSIKPDISRSKITLFILFSCTWLSFSLFNFYTTIILARDSKEIRHINNDSIGNL